MIHHLPTTAHHRPPRSATIRHDPPRSATIHQAAPNSWAIKYYKGLGTSTSVEAKQYFSNLPLHELTFTWSGPERRAPRTNRPRP